MKKQSKKPTKTELLKFVDGIYWKISRALEGADHFRNLKDLILKEERQHRKGAPNGCSSPKNYPATAAMKYFAVKYIANGRLHGAPEPTDVRTSRS